MTTQQPAHHLAGHPVEHKAYGWLGEVAQYAHTKEQIMIIWQHGSSHRGASLADKVDLVLLPEQTALMLEW